MLIIPLFIFPGGIYMKKLFGVLFCLVLFLNSYINVLSAEYNPKTTAKSLILMEASTGKILYEKNAHQSLPPASVTKIMTMLLICEAIERGEVDLQTQVTASERAKSMGGSTIFLETNEVMSLDDLLKGIAVASANDACVAVAEHLCGSVESFVELMNKRAGQLGMKDTNFVTCNGLDAENHHTSAYDIALMSRQLLKYDIIQKYTTIWMDSLRNGAFQLANTNKLIRFYKGANGLKTGSTSKAGNCISATAKRENMQLIAVVLGCETSKERFSEASELLNYGFANYAVVKHSEKGSKVKTIRVLNGRADSINAITDTETNVLIKKSEQDNIKVYQNIEEKLTAPIKKNEVVGELIVTLNGETLITSPLVSDRAVKKKTSSDYFIGFFKSLLKQ